MPETFTADDFGVAAAPESGTATFKPEDFNSAPVPDIFSPADFSANAPAQKANTREARRIELKLEMERVRSEPEAKVWGASPRGPLSSIVEGVNKGAGAIVRGLGHLMETIPPNSNPDIAQANPGNLEDLLQKEHQAKIADPLKFKEAIERNPLTRAGKYMQETGEAFAPEDFERESVANQALSGAAELAPVMNPAAPVIIGLQGLGRDLQNDFDQLKEKGSSDQDAAAGAIRKAEAAGFSQFAVWSVLPAPLRKLGEKYLIARVGEDGAKRFLAGRIATGAEGAVLGGSTKAAENVATGEPPGQDVGKSALGMATLNLGLPRLANAEKAEPGSASEPLRGQKAPTKPPETPSSGNLGTKVPVTRDLAAELQAAMKGNQVGPPDTVQNNSISPSTIQTSSSELAADKSAGVSDNQAEAIKDNLVGHAVKEITGQIPGAKVTIEAPPAKAKGAEFTAEDFAPAAEQDSPAWQRSVDRHHQEIMVRAKRLGISADENDPDAMDLAIAMATGGTDHVEAFIEDRVFGPLKDRYLHLPDEHPLKLGHDELFEAKQRASDLRQLAGLKPIPPLTSEKPVLEQHADLQKQLEEELGQEPNKPSEASGSDAVKQSVHSDAGGPAENLEPKPEEVNRSSASHPAEPETSSKTSPAGVPEPVVEAKRAEKAGESPEEFLARHNKALPEPKVERQLERQPEGQPSEFQSDLERQASAEDAQPDAIEEWLDKAIAATDPLRGNRMMEGVLGAPVWLTETLVHGALKTFRVAYRASKNLKASIEEGLLWLHEQKIKGFDAHEARTWLTQAAQQAAEAKSGEEPGAASGMAGEPDLGRPPKAGERDWKTVRAELGQADTELRAAIHEKQVSKASRAERMQKVSMATAKLRNLQEELNTHPGYVEDLMTRHHELSEQLKAETDDAKRNELRYKAEQLASELGETPEALRNRIHQELQGKGILPKPAEAPPAGRTLDDLTDWMKQQGVDSPKRSLRERLDIARNLAERWQNTKDSLERARVGIATAWRAGLESIKHPPIDTGFRNAFKEWLFYDTYTGAQTKRWIREIKSKVESPLRRMAMAIWLDAKGDEGLLRYQLTAVPERFAPVWKTALELTAGEKELARKIKADFEQKLNDGKNAGLIEKGRADYGVPQRWKKAPEPVSDQAFATEDGPKGSPGNWRAKLDPRDPFFSFQREHPTYFEGIMHGGIPEGLDIADLVAVYHEAFHKSLSSRAAIWAMKNELASDGRPLVKISGAARLANEGEPGTYFVDSKAHDKSDVAADGRPYRPIDHFALRDWKVANKTADGKLVMVRGDMLVHPEVYDFLKNELLKSPLREGRAGQILNPIFRSSAFLKSSKLALGTFHLATIAEHAFFHDLTGPITRGFEIDLREPDQALLVKHGLELGLSGPQAAFEEGLSSHGGLFERIPGIGDLSRKFSDWLFKTYIPEVSMKVGLTVLERNRTRYADKLSEGQLAELTAHQMNAAFGLQNYRLLGSNKVILDLNQLALLAPQFLYARAKVVGQALKPYGKEQRRMLVLQAATLYVGARLLNSLFNDGDPHWEPRNAFSLVINGRAYSIRTIVGDAWHMFTDFKSFASGRLAPLLRIAIETITQRDLRTGARKEPPIQTEWIPSRMAQNLVVDLAKWLTPVGVEGMLPGAAGREQGPVDAALASIGIGSRKYTAQAEVKEWARDFNRKGDAHARTYQRQRDAEPHGETAYRKLDALLDAGKLSQAAREYQALQNDGHKPTSIAAHYDKSQPLTGTKVRDEAFLKTLSEKQKQVYQRAMAEGKKRQEAFDAMALKLKNGWVLVDQP